MKPDLWETNNKNERPGPPPATPASQQHRCPLTSSFNVDLKSKALLKSEGGVPLCLEQRCASNQACQTESFESRKPVSVQSRRSSEGRKQAFRECQAEEGAERLVVLGKSHKPAHRVPSHLSAGANDLSLSIRWEMGVGRGGGCKRPWTLQASWVSDCMNLLGRQISGER